MKRQHNELCVECIAFSEPLRAVLSTTVDRNIGPLKRLRMELAALPIADKKMEDDLMIENLPVLTINQLRFVWLIFPMTHDRSTLRIGAGS